MTPTQPSYADRENYLSSMALTLYANAPESFNQFSAHNPSKTVANYAYSVVFDSQQYRDHKFTDAEAEILIDKIVKMLRVRR